MSLARRSQTSGGDVVCYKWVEVGGCWACGCSICKHQCLELNASCNWEQVQGDKERCNMGSFGLVEDQSCRCIFKSSVKVWLCMMEVQLWRAVVHSRNDKGLDKTWAAYCVRKGWSFCCRCSANMQDRAVFAMWSLKVSWSLKITQRFLTELDGVIVERT